MECARSLIPWQQPSITQIMQARELATLNKTSCKTWLLQLNNANKRISSSITITSITNAQCDPTNQSSPHKLITKNMLTITWSNKTISSSNVRATQPTKQPTQLNKELNFKGGITIGYHRRKWTAEYGRASKETPIKRERRLLSITKLTHTLNSLGNETHNSLSIGMGD